MPPIGFKPPMLRTCRGEVTPVNRVKVSRRFGALHISINPCKYDLLLMWKEQRRNIESADGSSAAPRERQTATIRYVDRPDVGETFADSITGLVFDGQTPRIEFSVTRVDEVKPDAAKIGR